MVAPISIRNISCICKLTSFLLSFTIYWPRFNDEKSILSVLSTGLLITLDLCDDICCNYWHRSKSQLVFEEIGLIDISIKIVLTDLFPMHPFSNL